MEFFTAPLFIMKKSMIYLQEQIDKQNCIDEQKLLNQNKKIKKEVPQNIKKNEVKNEEVN